MNEFPGIRPCPGGVEIDLKVVPGARSDRLMGALGARVKIRTSAPPEAGKANKAIVKLLAKTFDIPHNKIELISGPASPEKTVRVSDIDLNVARERLV